MAEDLCISNSSRGEEYRTLLPQIKCLIADENDLIVNPANVAAALKETFGFLWVGFYLVKDEELVLAPFQGPVACTRIKRGRGVCGEAWERAETLVVPDVDTFPGHIACSSLSRSEIMISFLRTGGELWDVPDVNRESLSGFDDVDAHFLRELCSCL